MAKSSVRKKQTKKATQKPKNNSKLPVKKLTLRQKIARSRQDLLARRPHRSFRRSYRRDYVRSLHLPGYGAFTSLVVKHLAKHRKVFIVSVAVYAILTAFLVGIANQDVYMQSIGVLKETGGNIFSGAWGEIGKGTLLLATVASGNFDGGRGEVQQVYALLIFLLVWMSTVWLLRAQFAGKKPRFRDALYNSSAPLVSTVLVALLFLIQLLPAAIGVMVLQVANDSLSGGLAMIVFFVAILLIVLSLYLVTSTFIALVVVTLPGMYPWQAIKVAGDLVIGRRVRILLRLVWGCLVTIIMWATIMIPVVMFTLWLQTTFKQLIVLPIVPVALVIISASATVFLSSYVYILYRKIVDDETSKS